MPIKINGATSGSTTITAPNTGGDESIELSTALASKADEQTAWQDFTPSWNNVTVGNGTVIARYQQIGKTVYGWVSFTLGSTSAIASIPEINVPVTASANVPDQMSIGLATYTDTGTGRYPGFTEYRTGSPATIQLRLWSETGTYVVSGGITATIPFTWTTSDRLTITFQYEAA